MLSQDSLWNTLRVSLNWLCPQRLKGKCPDQGHRAWHHRYKFPGLLSPAPCSCSRPCYFLQHQSTWVGRVHHPTHRLGSQALSPPSLGMRGSSPCSLSGVRLGWWVWSADQANDAVVAPWLLASIPEIESQDKWFSHGDYVKLQKTELELPRTTTQKELLWNSSRWREPWPSHVWRTYLQNLNDRRSQGKLSSYQLIGILPLVNRLQPHCVRVSYHWASGQTSPGGTLKNNLLCPAHPPPLPLSEWHPPPLPTKRTQAAKGSLGNTWYTSYIY